MVWGEPAVGLRDKLVPDRGSGRVVQFWEYIDGLRCATGEGKEPRHGCAVHVWPHAAVLRGCHAPERQLQRGNVSRMVLATGGRGHGGEQRGRRRSEHALAKIRVRVGMAREEPSNDVPDMRNGG